MADDLVLEGDEYDLAIWGGTSFDLEIEYVEDNDEATPIPLLEGDEIIGQIRQYPNAPLLAEFETEITDGPNGVFRIALTGNQTRHLVDKALFEIALVSGSVVRGLLRGRVQYTRGVIE